MGYFCLTKEEYIELIKELGMTTKKWTYSKMKEFHKRRKEIINDSKYGMTVIKSKKKNKRK